ADGSVLALQVNTGVKVWQYTFAGNVINTAPVVEGNLVYVCHGEENLDVAQNGRVICLDAGQISGGQPKLVWEKVGIKAGLASPAVHEGKLYVPDDGAALHCFDPKNGKPLWRYKYGRVSRGAPVIA